MFSGGGGGNEQDCKWNVPAKPTPANSFLGCRRMIAAMVCDFGRIWMGDWDGEFALRSSELSGLLVI